MFGMSLWALVSATIIVTAQTPGQIMAGRILNCRRHDPRTMWQCDWAGAFLVLTVTD
jgi:hypothetical protein